MTLLKDFWFLLKPFLTGHQHKRNIALLVVILALSLVGVQISVWFNKWNASFYNALQERNIDAFYQQITLWALLFIASVSDSLAQNFLRRTAELRWRERLTGLSLSHWLDRQAYFRLQWSAPLADNPDQRIAEDIQQFCHRTITLVFSFISTMVRLGAFVSILWTISKSFTVEGHAIPGYILWIALIYAGIANWLAVLIGRRLTEFNVTHQRFEADFRYGLVRIREYAQGIALYGGEQEELRDLKSRFGYVLGNLRQIIRRETLLGAFVSAHGLISSLMSYLVVMPHYFAGAITLGTLMQAASAFIQTERALSWLVGAYSGIAEWKATFDRLRQFRKATAAAAAGPSSHRAEPVASRELVLDGLTLNLPDGGALLNDLDLRFQPGSRTLLSGASGCGKSTLFNAIAGIWPYFDGQIILPRNAQALFLPQRAYLPVGSLRRAVCYPQAAEAHEDDAIRATLQACGLGALADKLDVQETWSQRLSPGEQQRLAFARALLIRPDFLFLDEATSALDEAAEAQLYRLIFAKLPDTAIISIAHRQTVGAFHTHHIDLAQSYGAQSRNHDVTPRTPSAAWGTV